MDFVIPIDQWLALLGADPLAVAGLAFTQGGWAVVALWLLWWLWRHYRPKWLAARRTKYVSQWDWVVLSIYIPRANEQMPQAVEHIFSALTGTWKRIDWVEKWWQGKVQAEFSFELISRQGQIEFLIRGPRHYRDLIEAAVYAQYPDAEVAETTDYTEPFADLSWPDHDGGYDIWGTEFKQFKEFYYPIKTWKDFGESVEGFRDPVYSIIEVISRLGSGEEFWLQVVVSPTDHAWQIAGDRFVKKLLGKTPPPAPTVTSKVLGVAGQGVDAVIHSVIPPFEVAKDKKPKEPPQYITKENKVIEGIQEKISKIGLHARLRAVYVARKEIFNKTKVKEGFLGALQQYVDLYANGFTQDTDSKVSGSHLYYQRDKKVAVRKNSMLKSFRTRNMRQGANFGQGFILNVEELASLWHFPVGSLKAVVIKKAESAKAEAPFGLPMGADSLPGDDAIPFAAINGQTELTAVHQPPVDVPVEGLPAEESVGFAPAETAAKTEARVVTAPPEDLPVG
ncbi:MAG: hypothetical protein AAB817_03130 [Patescibacteria group bacterium]